MHTEAAIAARRQASRALRDLDLEACQAHATDALEHAIAATVQGEPSDGATAIQAAATAASTLVLLQVRLARIEAGLRP